MMQTMKFGQNVWVGRIIVWMLLIMIEVIMATHIKWIPNGAYNNHQRHWNEQQHNIEIQDAVGQFENNNNKTSFCVLMVLFLTLVVYYHRYQKEQQSKSSINKKQQQFPETFRQTRLAMRFKKTN